MNDTPKIDAEGIGRRLAELRELMSYSQGTMARNLRIKRERLASYESGRIALPWEVYRSLGESFFVNPFWLATGDGSPMEYFARGLLSAGIPPRTPFASAFASDARFWERPKEMPVSNATSVRSALESMASELRHFLALPASRRAAIQREPWFMERVRTLRALLAASAGETEDLKQATVPRGDWLAKIQPPEDEKETIDGPQIVDDKSAVPTEIRNWNSLQKRLGALVSNMGSREKLMNDFSISKQTASAWLSGLRKPDAETTIRLLRWVENGGRH